MNMSENASTGSKKVYCKLKCKNSCINPMSYFRSEIYVLAPLLTNCIWIAMYICSMTLIVMIS